MKTPIDPDLLAAFLAGTLPETERRAVIERLSRDSEARELLQMAHQALQAAADEPEDATADDAAPSAPARAPERAPARAPERARPARTRRFGYAAALVALVAVGLALRLALAPPATDALRTTDGDGTELVVEVRPSDLALRWSPVEDAYRYRIVVWDPVDARMVAEHETRAVAVDDAFLDTLRARLQSGRSYTLRIDAIDAQNRRISRSEAVSLRLP